MLGFFSVRSGGLSPTRLVWTRLSRASGHENGDRTGEQDSRAIRTVFRDHCYIVENVLIRVQQAGAPRDGGPRSLGLELQEDVYHSVEVPDEVVGLGLAQGVFGEGAPTHGDATEAGGLRGLHVERGVADVDGIIS